MPPDGARSVSRDAAQWSWYPIAGEDAAVPDWLEHVRALRSRVLYAGGRRPEFGPRGERHGDPDPLDLRSAHVVARVAGAVAGSVRLTPLGCALPSLTEQTIGAARLDELLRTLQLSRGQVVEHGRWTVAPECRLTGLGVYLMCASFALAYELGFPSSVATVSRDVVPILTHAGARVAKGIPALRSEKYNDELVVLHGTQSEFPAPALAEFQNMAHALGLGAVYNAGLRSTFAAS